MDGGFCFAEGLAVIDDDLIGWMAAGFAKPGKSKKDAAAVLGRQPSAISAIMKGEREIKAKEIPILAAYFGMDPPARFLADYEPAATIPLVGYVRAGATAHFYSTADNPNERVPSVDGATEATVAVEVHGESLGPFFDRWLIYYDDVRSPVTEDLYGELCVVGLPDDRVLVKQIRPSRSPGLFHLYSNTLEPPILDVAVDWAAKVKNLARR